MASGLLLVACFPRPNLLIQNFLELLKLVDNVRAASEDRCGQLFKVDGIVLGKLRESHDYGQRVVNRMLCIPEFFMKFNKIFVANDIRRLH